MQKPIDLTESVLMPIPVELLEEVGIAPYDTIQMYISRGRLIIEPVDEEELLCRSCPIANLREDC